MRSTVSCARAQPVEWAAMPAQAMTLLGCMGTGSSAGASSGSGEDGGEDDIDRSGGEGGIIVDMGVMTGEICWVRSMAAAWMAAAAMREMVSRRREALAGDSFSPCHPSTAQLLHCLFLVRLAGGELGGGVSVEGCVSAAWVLTVGAPTGDERAVMVVEGHR
jgi:hypothetical protein